MIQHKKFQYIKTLIQHGETIMLEGEAGAGKTTILMDVAKELGLKFYSITGTQQTSVANLLGFRSVTGEYIPVQLREAYEFGGMYLMDEYDAFNPNTILALNSIENGFLAFPDKVINAHPDFILCATCNPSNEHAAFTGRSTQDRAALDRFLKVRVDRDGSLELALTSEHASRHAEEMRKLLRDNGVVSRIISMRDTMRFHRLSGLHKEGVIDDNPLDLLVGDNKELRESLQDFSGALVAASVDINSTDSLEALEKLIKDKIKAKSC